MMTVILFAILAIACLLYGLLIRSVAFGTKFYLVWFAGAAFAALASVIFYTGFWQMLPAWVRLLTEMIVLLGILLLAIVEACAASAFSMQGPPGLEYILVLGAQVKPKGPSRALRYRLDEALNYLNENPECICIVSGGQGFNEPCSEAEAMRKYLADQGISPDRILLEDTSTSTVENIKNSMRIVDLKQTKVGIVTNNFHVFRAWHLAKRMGIEHAYAIAAYSSPLFLPNNMFREFFGIMKDLTRVHTEKENDDEIL